MKTTILLCLCILLFLQPLSSQSCGDLNHNNNVEPDDVATLVEYFFFDNATFASFTTADVNFDLSVDLADLSYLDDFVAGTGPTPHCYLEELHLQSHIYKGIGEVLADTFSVEQPADKFGEAAFMADEYRSHYQTLVEDGIVSGTEGGGLTDLGSLFLALSAHIDRGEYKSVAASLTELDSILRTTYLDPGLAVLSPELKVQIEGLSRAMGDAIETARALTEPEELTNHFFDLLELYNQPLDSLQKLADSLLAITDEEVIALLELDDEELLQLLREPEALKQSPEVRDFFLFFQEQPELVTANFLRAGFQLAIVEIGDYLYQYACLAGNIEAVPISLIGAWEDDCETVCDTRNCMLKDVKIVNWRSSCALAKGTIIAILKRVPVRITNQVKKEVLKALQALQKKLQNTQGIRVCLRIQWEHCEETWCLLSIVTNKEWVAKMSDWKEVKGPGLLNCWPKTKDFVRKLNDFRKERDKLVKTCCDNL